MTVKKRKEPPFVKVPLWWAESVAEATKSPAVLVGIRLLYAAWKAKSMTFSLPNSYLQRHGVSREIKRRVLRDLETAGLITVERRHGKSPRVTIVVL
jgi:ribosomal protein S19E (S16A)